MSKLLSYAQALLASVPVIGMAVAACVPPLRSRPYVSQPYGDIYVVPCGPGAFQNVAFTINPPRKVILLQGNDANGSTTNVYLSFVQLQTALVAGNLVLTAAGALRGYRFLPVSSVNTPLMLSFRKPIGGPLFLSGNDTGQPGSNMIILATDDYTGITPFGNGGNE